MTMSIYGIYLYMGSMSYAKEEFILFWIYFDFLDLSFFRILPLYGVYLNAVVPMLISCLFLLPLW